MDEEVQMIALQRWRKGGPTPAHALPTTTIVTVVIPSCKHTIDKVSGEIRP